MLLNLSELVQRPSKSPSQAALAGRIIAVLTHSLAAQVESCVGSGKFESTPVIEVQPLYKDRSGKARRVATQFKLEVCKVVANTELRSAQQFLAGRSAKFALASVRKSRLARKKVSRTSLQAKHGSSYKKLRMKIYRKRAHKACQNLRWAGVVLDGLRVGNLEWMVYALENMETRQGLWLPPQASQR